MKRIHIFSTVIFLVLLVVCLSGCGANPSETLNVDFEAHETTPTTANDNITAGEAKSQFQLFEMEQVGYSSVGGFDYYRDTVTDVMYLRYRFMSGYAGGGGVAAMLDPETGLPLTYTRYKELYDLKPKE